jgi:hypothetical protein
VDHSGFQALCHSISQYLPRMTEEARHSQQRQLISEIRFEVLHSLMRNKHAHLYIATSGHHVFTSGDLRVTVRHYMDVEIRVSSLSGD